MSLSWISPDHTGAFSVGVTGKITCGSGGGGGPIDISAIWSGDVLTKEWKAEPAITGGEVTQPADTDEENPKEIGPGETVTLAVSEATDQDTWTQGTESDQEADAVHYKWTSGDGGFVTDNNPNGDATEVTTQTAQWKAPEEPGDYTVTCEIDDEPAAVEEPDTGDRDDDPVMRTVHIKVVVGESSATLKLYKDAELTEEATGTIGGNVYVVLEVKLGKYQKLASSSATLRIEENYEEHSETERRLDQAVSFTDGWQKKDANDEWQTTTETPQSKNNSGDDQYFRKVWSWATYNKPLGHNEQHTVEIVKVDNGEDTELSFTPTNEGDDGKDGPESVDADVGNLVITDVSTNAENPDYFKFDPDSTDQSLVNPTISFTIKDDGDKHRYKWWVWVMPTRGEPNSVEITGVMDAPDSREVTINQPSQDYTQDHPLTEWGAYTFNIRVQEIKDTEDEGIGEPWVDFRSTKLSVSQHSINFILDGQDNVTAQVTYTLTDEDNLPATSVHIDFLTPDLELRTSKEGATQPNIQHTVNLHTFTSSDFGIDSTGYRWTALFISEDSHGKEYRDHQNKRTGVVNKDEPRYFHIEEDWMKKGGVTYKALSDAPQLATVYAKGGWVVQAKNVTGSHDILDLDNPDEALELWGLQWREPNSINFRDFDSFRSFQHYEQRHTNRYVHVIGAHNNENAHDYGLSVNDNRWSFTFVKSLQNDGTDQPNDVIKTTIHEVGHQFGLAHHSDTDTNDITWNGKLCAMSESYPSATTDFWFCPFHMGLLAGSTFPSH